VKSIQTLTYALHVPGKDVQLYWFVVPEGMSAEDAFQSQEHHGPFATDDEVNESQRIVLLGPLCRVTEALLPPVSDRLH
jgi:hypothetical protein